MSETAEPVIDVSGLSKSFGSRKVVDDISLDVKRGQIVGFLGPNGSGKTTTIRMICGLLTPDAGKGRVLGFDVLSQSREIKGETGYMTQRFSFYEDLTIRENLAFVARLYGLRPVSRIVADTLADLGLTSRQNQLAGSLSGGWKQRLALAACLMHAPQLLLLDEPTAGVDPKARREFWDEIHARAADGLTVLVSTHYMDEAERCHRIAYISYGRMLASGTVKEVVEAANLATYVVAVDDPHLADRIRDMPGVEEVTSFGASLHVVGADKAALDASMAELRGSGIAVEAAPTGLEDVFIKFMGEAQRRGDGA